MSSVCGQEVNLDNYLVVSLNSPTYGPPQTRIWITEPLLQWVLQEGSTLTNGIWVIESRSSADSEQMQQRSEDVAANGVFPVGWWSSKYHERSGKSNWIKSFCHRDSDAHRQLLRQSKIWIEHKRSNTSMRSTRLDVAHFVGFERLSIIGRPEATPSLDKHSYRSWSNTGSSRRSVRSHGLTVFICRAE